MTLSPFPVPGLSGRLRKIHALPASLKAMTGLAAGSPVPYDCTAGRGWRNRFNLNLKLLAGRGVGTLVIFNS